MTTPDRTEFAEYYLVVSHMNDTEQLIKDGGLLVVGAEFSLDTGVVDFFDEHDGA